MDYKILEIHPDQILVEFINGVLATVIVESDWTVEQIDDAVSYADPEYILPVEELINPNISVGESRTSKRILFDNDLPDVELEEVLGGDVVPEPKYQREIELDDILRARYYAAKGDNRLWDAIDNFLLATADPTDTLGGIETWVDHVNKVTETALEVAAAHAEENQASADVFEQAMKELENE